MMNPHWILATLLVTAASSSENHALSVVNRELKARVVARNWPSTPQSIYCEALVFHSKQGLAEEFLVSLSESDVPDIDTYESAMARALQVSPLQGPEKRLLESMVSFRAHSPQCEMHRTLARSLLRNSQNIKMEKPGVIFSGKHGILTVEEVFRTYQTLPKVELLPSEIIAGESQHVGLILFGNFGEHIFAQAFLKLRELGVAFAVRNLGAVDYEEQNSMFATETTLKGYGMRLDIRNIEYKVFDDRSDNVGDKDSTSGQVDDLSETSHAIAGVNLTALGINDAYSRKELWSTHHEHDLKSSIIPPAWRRRDLPLQATMAALLDDCDPLLTLQQVAQDLPSMASSLVQMSVSDDIRSAAEVFAEKGLRTETLAINGLALSINQPTFNVFHILDVLREELASSRKLEEDLLGVGLPQEAVSKVQEASREGKAFYEDDGSVTNESPRKRQEVVRIDVARGWKGAITYLNDIEKDPQYASWPSSLRQMLMSLQMGGPPTVRRNLFTILGVIDPKVSAANPGLLLSTQLMQSSYPARAGVLVVDTDELGTCSSYLSLKTNEDEACPVAPLTWNEKDFETTVVNALVFHRIIRKSQRDTASLRGAFTAYVDYLIDYLDEVADSGSAFFVSDLLDFHASLYEGLQVSDSSAARKSAANHLLVAHDDEDYQSYGLALKFAAQRNLKPGMSFLNGIPLPVELDNESVNRIFGEEQNHVFNLIVSGEISESSPRSIYGHLLKGENVHSQVHPLLLGSGNEGSDYVYLGDAFGADAVFWDPKAVLGSETFVVDGVFDYSKPDGVQLAISFLEVAATYEGKESESIAFRVLPATRSASVSPLCSAFANAKGASIEVLLSLLRKWNDVSLSSTRLLDEVNDDLKNLLNNEEKSALCQAQDYFETLSDSDFVSANGRVLSTASFTAADLDILVTLESKLAVAVRELLYPVLEAESNELSLLLMSKAASFLATSYEDSKPRQSLTSVFEKLIVEDPKMNDLRLSWNKEETHTNKIHIEAMLNPISEATQRVAPLLLLIRDQLQLPIDLILIPLPSLESDSKVPLTSYYRFVTGGELGEVYFQNLPKNHILTVRTDVPEAWDIQQSQSIQDTDNLRCDDKAGCGDDCQSQVNHTTEIEYALQHLLVFGQCYEAGGSPPNGLQLTLVRDQADTLSSAEVGLDGSQPYDSGTQISDEEYTDTLVMKTVGYWQLRANPGVWKLGVAKSSKGFTMFDMVEGTAENGRLAVDKNFTPTDIDKSVFVEDFLNKGDLLIVKRKPGVDPKSSLFYETSNANGADGNDDTIHVFSLATGHLYERFLKIMMLSVTKRTSSNVKFWLFENFLSPSFKASAKFMAKEIGCEIEFVTYKWPQWLRNQSEKQRIIWGYKILFLDVLFPLDVKKIIYVDADQVVRGDLRELWNMDLQGAPYGYTPFCSSREETLGYQFWREGFWKSHLQGRPYHISALYVVDLELFRRTLVGDTLRSIYQQLSADPNSLSNLDQDLPNYAQSTVPIFSLPQEWLWCESWCSDETKAKAKTIDLCNNPMHKEPKVSMAKRVIDGPLFKESWIELDQEVEELNAKFLSTS